MANSRRQRTHTALLIAALDLFEGQGFEQTTVAQIAAEVGVTEMTFFRHFPSKESVLLDDPYDPVIAEAIRTEPVTDPALIRAAHGIRRALEGFPEPETDLLQRRIRIIADSAALRASSARNNIATEDRIADQLHADGASTLQARVAAAALMATLTAALFEWAQHDQLSIADAVGAALDTLEPTHG